MLEKLPFYGQVLVMVAIALLIVALVYWFLPLPSVKTLHAEIDELQTSLEAKEQEIRRGQTIEARGRCPAQRASTVTLVPSGEFSSHVTLSQSVAPPASKTEETSVPLALYDGTAVAVPRACDPTRDTPR